MLNVRLKQHEEAFTEQTPEGTVVMAADGKIYRLNKMGQFLWERCTGTHTINDVVDELMQVIVNGPGAEQVAADIQLFAEFLLEKSLVTAEPTLDNSAEIQTNSF